MTPDRTFFVRETGIWPVPHGYDGSYANWADALRDCDPFQNAAPCWQNYNGPVGRWDRRTIAEQLGQPEDSSAWVTCPDCKRSHGPLVSCSVLSAHPLELLALRMGNNNAFRF